MKKADNQMITDTLRKSGYRATPGKIAILQTLTDAGQPLTIMDLLKKLGTKIDQATVYRALESFAETKLVRKVNFNDRSTRYESLLDSHHHHHLICRDCGKVEDIDICNEKLEKKALAQSKSFKSIQNHSVEFFGLCNNCQPKTA